MAGSDKDLFFFHDFVAKSVASYRNGCQTKLDQGRVSSQVEIDENLLQVVMDSAEEIECPIYNHIWTQRFTTETEIPEEDIGTLRDFRIVLRTRTAEKLVSLFVSI